MHTKERRGRGKRERREAREEKSREQKRKGSQETTREYRADKADTLQGSPSYYFLIYISSISHHRGRSRRRVSSPASHQRTHSRNHDLDLPKALVLVAGW